MAKKHHIKFSEIGLTKNGFNDFDIVIFRNINTLIFLKITKILLYRPNLSQKKLRFRFYSHKMAKKHHNIQQNWFY